MPADIADDFNRADEELEASANWSVSDVDGTFTIVSNRLDITSTLGRVAAFWSADTFGPDCFVESDYVTNGTADVGISLRHDGGDPDSGNLYAARDNGADYDIIKIVAGSFARLGTGGDGATGLMRFEAIGSTLTLYVDNVQTVQVTDSDLTGAGRVGYTSVVGDNGVWDDFRAGDLAAKNMFLLLGVP